MLQNGSESNDKVINIEEKDKKNPRIVESIQNNKKSIIDFFVFAIVTAYFVWATQFYIEETGKLSAKAITF